MKQDLEAFAVATSLLAALFVAQPAFAQKPGGVLRVHQWDSPPSLSIHEEVTIATVVPMMGVFNNLVMYDQHVPQNSLQSIVPDLATSWSWSEDGTQLTFRLRDGVKWHDGRPFTAKDVQCTWDLLLGKSQEKLRTNPRKAWYQNLEKITAESDCKDYTVGVTVAEGGLDEPDQKFYETYVCGADRNYTGYCNDETDRLIDRQSMEAQPEQRRKLVWEVERKLAEDASRPVLLYSRFATCMQPRLKGLTTMTNSRFNGWRMEDVWLEK